MKRKRDPADDETPSKVSRSGRIIKKGPVFSEVPYSSKLPRYGRWTTKDKEKLLTCFKKFPGVQYNPLTIFRSIKTKPRAQVEEYVAKLRRRTADHITKIRRKQPPILTWFQVADEVTWLKDDEELHEIIHTVLGIHANEAMTMQVKNPLVNFSNLYKYLKVLHKCETLPELTPAESVILLDCFKHLADILRESDVESQTEFMHQQYKKYFRHLYFATSSMSELALRINARASKNPPTTTKSKPPQAKSKPPQNQRSSMGPLLKAELRKKQLPKRKTKRQKALEKSKGEAECQSSQAGHDGSTDIPEKADVERSQEGGEYQRSHAGQERSNDIHERLDVWEDLDGLGDSHSNSEGTPNSIAHLDSNDVMNIHDHTPHHDLDPNDPDFLTQFANMFSLGSLNPFEIPTELMNIRRKTNTGNTESEAVSSGTDREKELLLRPAGGKTVSRPDVEAPPSKDHEIVVIADFQDIPGTSYSTSDMTHVVCNDHGNSGKCDRQPKVSNDHQHEVSSHHQPEVSSHHQPEIFSHQPEVFSHHQPEVSSHHQPAVFSHLQPEVSNDCRPKVSSDHLSEASSGHNSEGVL